MLDFELSVVCSVVYPPEAVGVLWTVRCPRAPADLDSHLRWAHNKHPALVSRLSRHYNVPPLRVPASP
jgi:hypothetical protein